ncbi:MAG: ABC transporter permease [Myxococcota bacterium]
MNRVLTVTVTELGRLLRDPSVIAFLVGPVILYPAIFWVASQFGLQEVTRMEREVYDVALDVEAPAALREALHSPSIALQELVGEPHSLVESGEVDLTIRTATTAERWRVELLHAAPRPRSKRALRQVKDTLYELRKDRFDALVDDPQAGWLAIDFDHAIQGGRTKVGRKVGALMVAFVAVFPMLFGGVYPAIDLFGTERERQTLETLLVSSAPRATWFVGKTLACIAMVLLAGIANAFAMALTLARLQQVLDDAIPDRFLIDVPSPELAIGAVVWLTTGVLVSSVMLLLSLLGRNYRESETLCTAAMVLGIVPGAGMLQLVDGQAPAWVGAVPMLNAVQALQRGAIGELQWADIGLASFVNLGIAAGLAGAAYVLCQREDFLIGGRLPRVLRWLRSEDPP